MSASQDPPEIASHRHKRLRTDTSLAQHDEPALFAKPQKDGTRVQRSQSVVSSTVSTQFLPVEFHSLRSKFEFTTMSIISSSKIGQKVNSLLERLDKFSFADLNAKPNVVLLHAKASVASKLVSIVEIAKRAIEQDGGKWWQYSRVHGEITELKEKKPKEAAGGKTLAEWEREKHSQQEQKQESAKDTMATELRDGNAPMAAESEDEEDGAAFETMEVDPGSGKATGGAEARRKIRAVPVLTIYLSRVPVADLKTAYG